MGSSMPSSPPQKLEPIGYLQDDDLLPAPARSAGLSYAKPVVAIVGVLLAAAFLVGTWREAPGMAVLIAMVIGVTILATIGRDRGLSPRGSDSGGLMAASILRIFAELATALARIAVVVTVAIIASIKFLSII